ncbi:T9SS type A sorting domain-containing protein [bacterium]|nr:T9SS type A sorting domain-containing protein [bacterium]
MRQFTKGFAGILLLTLLFMVSSPALAATEFGGVIDETTTWTLQDNDTIKVVDDVTVAEGVTLTIEPGVVVEFQGPYQFRVEGVLHAVGSIREDRADNERLLPWDEEDVQWITFTHDTTGMGAMSPEVWAEVNKDHLWKGLRFSESEGGSKLQYVIVEYGHAGGWSRKMLATDLDPMEQIETIDAGNDGTVELLTVDASGGLYLWSNPDGIWEAEEIASFASMISDVTVMDMDGDEDQDIVGSVRGDGLVFWLEQNGNSWNERTVDSSAGDVIGVAVGDFDNDEDYDISAIAEADSSLTWYENTGNGWNAEVLAQQMFQPVHIGAGNIDWENGDDIVLAMIDPEDSENFEHSFAYYRYDGSTWTESQIHGGDDPADQMYVIDMNGDGDDDIFVSTSEGDEMYSWVRSLDYDNDNNPVESWDDEQIKSRLTRLTAAWPARIPGEARARVLAVQGDTLNVWSKPSNNWISRQVTGNIPADTRALYADLDGDATPDIVGYSADTAELVRWMDRNQWPDNNGGGVLVRAVSVTIENTVVRYCRANNFGGGVFLWSSASTFRNNVVAHCYAEDSGGGIYLDQSANLEFRNLTLVDNHCGLYGPGIFFGANTEPLVRASIFVDNYIGDEGDSPFFSLTPVDFRYGISTELDELDQGDLIYPAGTQNFADFTFFTESDSSRAVDTGPSDDGRWVNEPVPNGGPLGDRINLGAWGGTPFAAKSLPVVSYPTIDDSATFASTTALGDTSLATVSIKNIGAGLLTIRYDSLSFKEDDGRPQDEWLEARDDWSIPRFDSFTLRPDSIGTFDVTYHPNDTEGEMNDNFQVRDYIYINLATAGGRLTYRVQSFVINPQQVLTVDTLDFGNVYFTSPETLFVDVANIGTTPINALSFKFPNDGFEAGEYTTPINPDTTVSVPIVANPIFKGNFGGTASISSGGQTHSYQVVANALGPVAFLPEYVGGNENAEDNVLDFAFLNLGETQKRTIEVKNDGNRPMLIGYEATDPDFMLHPDSDGLLIQPDETAICTVLFSPDLDDVERTYMDTLTFITSDNNTPNRTYETFLFQLEARSTSGGQYLSGDIPNQANNVEAVWGPAELGGDGNMRFIIAGTTRIPAGESITILPGVEVFFESPDEGATESTVPGVLLVEGKLEALGTEDDPILFAPLDDQKDQNGNDLRLHHGGIRFLACEEGTRLSHVVIDSARSLEYEEIAEVLGLRTSGEDAFEETVPNVYGHGGGMAIYNSSPLIEDVVVKNCMSHQDGGGIWIYQAAPTIVRTTVMDNIALGDNDDGTSLGHGGGVVIWGSKPNFYANTIINNEAVNDGGGLYIQSLSGGRIANNVIEQNLAAGAGGAAFITDESSPMILHNVFINNTATAGTDAIHISNLSKPVLRNSVIWDVHGEAGITTASGALPAVSHSFIEGGYEAGSNIMVDEPEFGSDPDKPYWPAGNQSNLVDAGYDGSGFEDYSFPPSLLTTVPDIGITGGPYAGYLGSPLQLSVFRNPSNSRSLVIGVNGLDELESAPGLTISTYNNDETIDPLPVIDADNRAWATAYSVDESTILSLRAYAMWMDGDEPVEAFVRRDISVSIYTQSQGASIATSDGASFTVPPNAASKEMMLLGRTELSADLPPAEDLVSAGARFNVDLPVKSLSKAAEVVLPYDAAVVPRGGERGVSVWLLDSDGEWSVLESFVDVEAGTVHVSSHKGGTFAVLYEASAIRSQLLPQTTALMQNYPNPFNPTTTIPFSVKSAGELKLSVYNVLGQRVATVASGWFGPGTHKVVWLGQDDAGQPVASGVYFYRMELNSSSGSVAQTRKLVLMR